MGVCCWNTERKSYRFYLLSPSSKTSFWKNSHFFQYLTPSKNLSHCHCRKTVFGSIDSAPSLKIFLAQMYILFSEGYKKKPIYIVRSLFIHRVADSHCGRGRVEKYSRRGASAFTDPYKNKQTSILSAHVWHPTVWLLKNTLLPPGRRGINSFFFFSM